MTQMSGIGGELNSTGTKANDKEGCLAQGKNSSS